MIYVVGILLLLGPLVFIHELGHYLAAKLCGVRVEVFSLGFGKRLLGFKRGGTDYRVSALPLGGYVRMAGENPMEEHTGDPGEFMSHPRWQRFIIAIAGPLMNGVLAVALLTGLYMVQYPDQHFLKEPAVIHWLEPKSIAERLGLQPGDRIVRIDDAETPNWEAVNEQLELLGPKPVPLVVQRGSQILQKQIGIPQGKDASTPLGIGPDQASFAESVDLSGAGAAAGMKAGDQLLEVNGQPVRLVSQIGDMIDGFQTTKEAPVALKLQRGNQIIDLTVTPRLTDGRYRIGVTFTQGTEQLAFPKALAASLRANGKSSLMIFGVLKRLFEARVSITQLTGPVGIGQLSGEALRLGPAVFIWIMAMVSVNLGIMNLLPIPILDGGLILLLVIEGALRRDIKREVKETVYQAAFVFLVIFAVVVIYNDIAKIVVSR